MTTGYGCKLCIATKGLCGGDIAGLPQTDLEFHEHLFEAHGLIVAMDGENGVQARARLRARFPDRANELEVPGP